QPVAAKVGMAGVDQAEIGLAGMDFAEIFQGACGWRGCDPEAKKRFYPRLCRDGVGHLLEGAPGRSAPEYQIFFKG
ncbi:MAG: hypothetical protein WCT30_02055, partial [Desulfurivibrionaceae bacterium]